MNNVPKIVVTTSRMANATIRSHAKGKATAWGIPYVERADVSLARVMGDVKAAFIFDNDGLSLSTTRAKLRYNLGTAALRLQSLAQGDGDVLVRAGELKPGDHVFDATLGLGRDAQVAARAVAPGGVVVGVESNWVLFTLVSEGLASHDTAGESVEIQPVFGDSRHILSSTEKGSFDVVVLDPMFSIPRRSDGNFETLREFADHTRLDPEWIQLARRVARRWVVVKAVYEEPWFQSEKLQRFHKGGPVRWFRAPPGS